MKQVFTSVLMLCAVLSISAQDYYPDKLFVKLKITERESIDERTDLAMLTEIINDNSNLKRVKSARKFLRFDDDMFLRLYEITVSEPRFRDEAMAILKNNKELEYVERVPIMRSTYQPNDPFANGNNMYHLDQIKAYTAWDIAQNNGTVTIAIVDDAVRFDHEDLEDNLWINTGEQNGTPGVDDDNNGYIDDIIGWDAANWDNNPAPAAPHSDDYFTHGTHCAGIAAARTDNNLGVAAISFNRAKIMSCKGKSDGSPGGTFDYIYEAFQYAVENKADIISCSWGGGGYSITHQNVMSYAVNQGSIVVAAAGNDNTSTIAYPAGYNDVLSVANTGYYDVRNQSSNYGSWVDIAAPGTDILASLRGSTNSYNYLSGTSMACPMVAGLLALMKSHKPSATNSELVTCLLNSADNIDAANPYYVGLLGAGRINATAAIQCLDANGGGGGNGQLELAQSLQLNPANPCLQNPLATTFNVKNTRQTSFTGYFTIDLHDHTSGDHIAELAASSNVTLPVNATMPSAITLQSNALQSYTGVSTGDYRFILWYYDNATQGWTQVGDGAYDNNFNIAIGNCASGDQYEANNSEHTAFLFPTNLSASTTIITTNGSDIHSTSDVDYYQINLPAGSKYTINARLHDSYQSDDGNTYTVDGALRQKQADGSWSEWADVEAEQMVITGGTSVLFHVESWYTGEQGTYKFEVVINRENFSSTNENEVASFKLYPTLTSDYISLKGIPRHTEQQVQIYGMDGKRALQHRLNQHDDEIDIDVSMLPPGKYILNILSTTGTINREFVISR